MLTEPAVDVTGEETLAQELLKDLRAAQTKLEAAREDAASLKVLLALRTHQHDLAWQDAQRLAAELEGARSRATGLEAALAEAWPTPPLRTPGRGRGTHGGGPGRGSARCSTASAAVPWTGGGSRRSSPGRARGAERRSRGGPARGAADRGAAGSGISG